MINRCSRPLCEFNRAVNIMNVPAWPEIIVRADENQILLMNVTPWKGLACTYAGCLLCGKSMSTSKKHGFRKVGSDIPWRGTEIRAFRDEL